MRGPSRVRGAGPYGDDEKDPTKDEPAPGSEGQKANPAAENTSSHDAGVSTGKEAATEPGANGSKGPEGAESADDSDNKPHQTGGIPPGPGADDWEYRLGGCESGFTYPDPTDTNIIWASCYGNEVTRYDARTKEAHSVSPWFHTIDSPPNEAKYRCHWTPPLAIDPFDHNTVYYGCQVVFKTSNAGESWSVISPDLSTKDPSRIVSSGGIVADNLGQFYGEVVFAIAPSTVQKGLIWAGTNDGKVWYTKDGGAQWNDVTANVTGLPAWATISRIYPSTFDAGTAYVAADAHLNDDRDPLLFKTSDFGKTWKSISTNLPKGPLAYTKTIVEDPNRKGLLFAGTGNGFYYSTNDGERWMPFQEGLPHAPVTWIEIQKTFHDVVVSTYGRGIYILDDISALEETKENDASAALTLYKPRDTYRLTSGGQAFVNFRLNAASKASVKIFDSNGKLVRELKSTPAKEGLNRRVWDLHYDPPTLVKFRTAAPDNKYIWDEPRFRDADYRSLTHWGIKPAEVGPLVTPGKYTIQLTVKGKTSKQDIEILKSPKTAASDDQLEAALKMQLKIRNDINSTSEMVNHIEWLRKQDEDIAKMLKVEGGNGELIKAVEAFDGKLKAVEYRLITPEEANSDDKYYSQTYRVYLKLIWLNGEVGTGAGDVAGGANFPLTQTSQDLLKDVEKDLAEAREQYRKLYDADLVALNQQLLGHAGTLVVAGSESRSANDHQ